MSSKANKPALTGADTLRGRVMMASSAGLSRAASFCYRRYRLVLLVTLTISVIGLGIASRLRLDSDLAALLPDSFPSVQHFALLEERVGGVGYLAVVAQNAEPEVLKRFARDVGPTLERMPEIRYVDYAAPSEFFRERALYFLSIEDLDTLEKRIARRVDWEISRRNPLYLDLEEDEDEASSEPPPLHMDDIRTRYEHQAKLLRRGNGTHPYYMDEEERLLVLLLKPNEPSSDLAFSKRLLDRVKRVLDDARPSSYGPNLDVRLTGTYARKVEQQAIIERDLGRASLLAFGLTLLFLASHFRRRLAVVWVALPLFLALVWTAAVAHLVFDRLNILTAFLGAILFGIGIDHGIHLLSRFSQEGGDGRQAVHKTFGLTGRAAAIAAVTTSVGFAGLILSRFRAFHEFGVLAVLGMVSIFIAYVTVGPALLGLYSRFGWRPHTRTLDQHNWSRLFLRRPGWSVLVSSAFCIVALADAPRVQFNYDFAAIQGAELPTFQLDEAVNRVLQRSQSPVVIPADDAKQEQQIARAVRDLHARLGSESSLDFVISIGDLVPPAQLEKHKILEKMAPHLRRIDPESLEPKQREELLELRGMVRAQPFDRSGLPIEVRRQFQKPGGSGAHGVVLAFPSVNLHDGREVRRLATQLRSVSIGDNAGLRLAAEAMVLADILELVLKESPTVLAVTLILIALSLVLMTRKLTHAAFCLAPAVLTVAVAICLLPILKVPLNYLNIIVIPVLFGLSVDGAVHILSRVQETGDAAFSAVIPETSRAIAGATITTALGFGALVAASHVGLRSIGEFALVGLAVNAIVSLVLLPSFVAWRQHKPV